MGCVVPGPPAPPFLCCWVAARLYAGAAENGAARVDGDRCDPWVPCRLCPRLSCGARGTWMLKVPEPLAEQSLLVLSFPLQQ